MFGPIGASEIPNRDVWRPGSRTKIGAAVVAGLAHKVRGRGVRAAGLSGYRACRSAWPGPALLPGAG